jgi:D-erythro-7,8-dihydroneopterin triphosphate epimerase
MWTEGSISWSTTVDRIIISDLQARCIIGVNDEERREKQDVILNISLFADLRQAGRSDTFADAVDYRAIKKQIVALVEASCYRLVEALAEAVANMCLQHPAIQRVQVRVDKPTALRFARSVGVEITRDRGGDE